MIDTIRFEIKDISVGIPKMVWENGQKVIKYSNGTNHQLYEFLKSWGGAITYDVSNNRHMQRELLINTDKDSYREKFRIVNRQASSNYKITILASYPNDSMIVEFSVPKYYYGTNIFQFVESPLQQKFQYGLNVNMEYHFKKLQNYLQKAITNFMSREFPDKKVNYEEVYLRRIDLCYNAIFRSAQEKLDWLNMAKQIQKKYDRGTKNRHYKESIFINTKDYSFKIYDKGEEFRKSDFKKLRPFLEKAEYEVVEDNDLFNKKLKVGFKRNQRKTKQDLFTEAGKQKLLDLSSRILRFEMTFRNSYFSYIYNNKVRGSKSEIHKSKKSIFYSKLKSIESQKDKYGGLIKGNEKFMKHISETIDLPVDEGLTVYSYLEETYNLQYIKSTTKEDINFWTTYYKKEYDKWISEINKERDFSLKLNYKSKLQNRDNLLSPATQITECPIIFDSLMFTEIAKAFKDNINQFIPKKYDSYSYMLKKLTEHNLMVEQNKGYLTENGMYNKQLQPNFFKSIFLILKTTTFKKYAQLIEMPGSTRHRIAKQLLILGITENMVVADFDIEADMSYENYYREMDNDHTFYIQFIDSTLQL